MSNTKLHILYISLLSLMLFLFVTDRYIPLSGVIVTIIGNSKSDSLYIGYIKNIPFFLYKHKMKLLIIFMFILSIIIAIIIYLATLNCVCREKINGSIIEIDMKYMSRKIFIMYHSNDNVAVKAYFTKYFTFQDLTLYYENGNLQMEGNESYARFYYENGNLHMEINYKDDRREGLEKIYYKDGKLKKEQYYINGILQNTKDNNVTIGNL